MLNTKTFRPCLRHGHTATDDYPGPEQKKNGKGRLRKKTLRLRTSLSYFTVLTRRIIHLKDPYVQERLWTGLAVDKVKRVISQLPEFQKKNAKFPTKAPRKHVCSSSVHDIFQIDLVIMQREAVIYKREKCKFILSLWTSLVDLCGYVLSQANPHN